MGLISPLTLIIELSLRNFLHSFQLLHQSQLPGSFNLVPGLVRNQFIMVIVAIIELEMLAEKASRLNQFIGDEVYNHDLINSS